MSVFSNEEIAYIWLYLADPFNIKRRVNMLKIASSVETLCKNLSNYRDEIVSAYGEEYYNTLANTRSRSLIKEFVDKNNLMSISIVTMASPEYPEPLKELTYPPIILFCKGDLSLFKTRMLAVVGTRNITRYGVDVTEMFVREFVRHDLTIVSGIAIGVDTVAHRTALNCNGKTIAVAPCGLDRVYPVENADLYSKVAENGLLISEYGIGQTVKQYTFNERNRIISGLSEGVFISEAGLRSGSMITANYALEQNKEIFAVPGNIYSKASLGANKLLKELQGALVTEPSDVLIALDIYEKPKPEQKAIQLSIEEMEIVKLLEKQEMHFEQILAQVNLNVKELNAVLLRLELFGIVKKLPSNFFTL